MIGEILGLFISPVTTSKKRAEEKNIKKEAIIALVLAIIIGLGTILGTYITIVKSVNKTYKSLSSYNKKQYKEVSAEEFKELKKDAKKKLLENAEFTKTFFKTAGYTLLAIVVISAMMFLIAMLIKSNLDIISCLAITNSAFLIYIVGFILNIIFSLIYSPIGYILLGLTFIYGLTTLTNTFRESVEVGDVNKYVQFASAVIGVVYIILLLIINHYINESLTAVKSLGL